MNTLTQHQKKIMFAAINRTRSCVPCTHSKNAFSCNNCMPSVDLIKIYALAEEILSLTKKHYTLNNIADVLVEFFYDSRYEPSKIVGCINCVNKAKDFVCNTEICSDHYISLLRERLEMISVNIELI